MSTAQPSPSSSTVAVSQLLVTAASFGLTIAVIAAVGTPHLPYSLARCLGGSLLALVAATHLATRRRPRPTRHRARPGRPPLRARDVRLARAAILATPLGAVILDAALSLPASPAAATASELTALTVAALLLCAGCLCARATVRRCRALRREGYRVIDIWLGYERLAERHPL